MYDDPLFFGPLLRKNSHSSDRRQYTATATATATTDAECRASLPPIRVLEGHIIIIVNLPLPFPPIQYEY